VTRQMPQLSGRLRHKIDDAIALARAWEMIRTAAGAGTPAWKQFHIARLELLYELALMRIFIEWEVFPKKRSFAIYVDIHPHSAWRRLPLGHFLQAWLMPKPLFWAAIGMSFGITRPQSSRVRNDSFPAPPAPVTKSSWPRVPHVYRASPPCATASSTVRRTLVSSLILLPCISVESATEALGQGGSSAIGTGHRRQPSVGSRVLAMNFAA
jgi:hypothetical protein